eukprot:COSAG02_NODE_35553_length_466_cov_1.348774_1_plen_58_part_00
MPKLKRTRAARLGISDYDYFPQLLIVVMACVHYGDEKFGGWVLENRLFGKDTWWLFY